MFLTPVQLVQAVGQWHVLSQQVARRNALTASTALAQRRRELDEVERFLAARTAGAAGRPRQARSTEVPARTGGATPGA